MTCDRVEDVFCASFSIFPFELVGMGFISTWVSPDVKAYNEEAKVKCNAKHENEANQNYTMKSRDRLQTASVCKP